MKKNCSVLVAICLASIFSSHTFADTSASESGLLKAIHDRVEQTRAIDTKKYEHMVEIAGNQRSELITKKDAVTKAYNEWHELKSSATLSNNIDTAKYKELESAAERYAQASKEFVDIQNKILANNNAPPRDVIPAEKVNQLNAK